MTLLVDTATGARTDAQGLGQRDVAHDGFAEAVSTRRPQRFIFTVASVRGAPRTFIYDIRASIPMEGGAIDWPCGKSRTFALVGDNPEALAA